VLVINGSGQLAGVGELGEIYMRSPHLAKGYLNDEEQTKEKFIVSPFTNDADDRWYRTGDLGRYLADGNVEFAGRNDLQVKIRGYRIELGEIEATLQQYPGIRDVVVIAREDEPGEKRLAAYLVWESEESEHTNNTREIYGYVKKRLPEYMVPAAYVNMTSMPRTPNGKIDRRALPKPDQSLIKREDREGQPTARSWTEEVLTGIWGDLLKREGIGLEEDFFELGGHSLLATQMVSRVRQVFKVEVPLRWLFETPKVVGFARRIDQAMQSEAEIAAPPITLAKRDALLPLSLLKNASGLSSSYSQTVLHITFRWCSSYRAFTSAGFGTRLD